MTIRVRFQNSEVKNKRRMHTILITWASYLTPQSLICVFDLYFWSLKLMIEVYGWSLWLKFVFGVWILFLKLVYDVYVWWVMFMVENCIWSLWLKIMFQVYVWILWFGLRSLKFRISKKQPARWFYALVVGKVFKTNVWNVLRQRISQKQETMCFMHAWWKKCLKCACGAFWCSESI